MLHYVVMDRTLKSKKRKKRLRIMICSLTLLFVIAISIATSVYKRSMTPTILKIAEVQVQSQSTYAINEAIVAVFSDVNYDTLVNVEKNAQNDVVLISANSVNVNSLARDTALLTQSKINSLFDSDIEIPIGTLSGIPLLSERGPNVYIEVAPVGVVNCLFESKFETAGINQTLHRIYLNVFGKVDLIVPTMHKTIDVCVPVLICETVIVGKVPETFLHGTLFGT